ncbi:MAG: 1-(5-phosphoribosyl)-5-[(5-phosphoribosylamino)methylideneamino]imidazole-4-carboxamide isomerase [Anaerolineae bacterium]|nr:1-(5-phosphoribosyl)-5-[(5-phosphoribosylamino)methylideneamino]imidazole-4-carboxamide isomerase [Anaerolineae bacterium]
MIVYPAIDLRAGKVVRLREGRPDQQTTFSADPVAVARAWLDYGAQWLHVVNLDGAFAQANDNLAVMEKIAKLGGFVQFGGGLRSFEDITRALSAGASRVVLGTVAVQDPALVERALAQYGAEAVCVGLDSRNGLVATHGWQNVTDVTATALGQRMAAAGVQHALYTDVARDGALTGSNVEATIALGRETGLQVIASGGVSTLDEIRTLAASGNVAGAIIGMALYTGALALPDALAAAQGA